MRRVNRFVVYLVGMVLLAAGIILNTKTSWGVSPVLSVAYCFADLLGFSFANVSMVYYVILFLAEIILKGKERRVFDLLQIPFAFVFTRCMNLLAALLPNAANLPTRIVMLVVAVMCTGFGAALMLATRMLPNPADGLVQVLGIRMHRNTGFAKNIFDASSVLVTIVLGLATRGRLIGIGVGTVCAVLGTGRFVALCNRLFQAKIERLVQRAPMRFLGETGEKGRLADEPNFVDKP